MLGKGFGEEANEVRATGSSQSSCERVSEGEQEGEGIDLRSVCGLGRERTVFVEVELVAHEGGRARGNYAQTLDLPDVATGWTELATVPGKVQVWVFEAIQQLTFTRSRPHRKNDHCFVEQKNYSVVRHHVGCDR